MERNEGTPTSAGLRPVRVLVVDDEPALQELLTCALYAFGVSVVGAARNGEEACRKFGELAPDAVIMDIRMPEMDGLEALQRIRQADPEAVVMMISGSDDATDVERARELGCAGFLRKPFDVQELFDDLGVGLRKLRARQGLQPMDPHYRRYVLGEGLDQPEVPAATTPGTGPSGAVVLETSVAAEVAGLRAENARLRARLLNMESVVEQIRRALEALGR